MTLSHGLAPNPGRRSVLCLGLGGLALLSGCAAPVATPQAPRRLTLGLWSGDPAADSGGPVDQDSGGSRIVGPHPWTHPVTGETVAVYERLNREKAGMKRQLFAARADGTALARVFDSRPGRADRVFTGDGFFPLGEWSEGQVRDYDLAEHSEGRITPFRASIRIVRLSAAFRDVPGSLRYDWTLRDMAGKIVFDERFDYSPGKGLVRFTDKLA